MQSDLLTLAKSLVKKHITGTRLANDTPLYLHSLRVYEILSHYTHEEDILLASLLHDIVEDSKITLEDLKKYGYSDRTLDLVDACTHDIHETNGNAQREGLLNKMIQKNDRDVWLIKVADMIDNIHSPYPSINDPSWHKSLLRKASIYLIFARPHLGDHPIYNHLERTIIMQINSIFGHSFTL